MDSDYFCGTVQSELTYLKARVYDIMRAIEKMKDDKKKTLSANFTDLTALIEQLTDMTNKLSKACPADWRKEKKEIEAKKAELVKKIDYWDAEHIAGGWVGG